MNSNNKTNDPIMNKSIQNLEQDTPASLLLAQATLSVPDGLSPTSFPLNPIINALQTQLNMSPQDFLDRDVSFRRLDFDITKDTSLADTLNFSFGDFGFTPFVNFIIESIKDGTLLFPLDELDFRTFILNFAASTSNRPPVVDNDVINALSPQAVGKTEVDFESNGFTLNAGPAFSDPDAGDVLTYSATFSGTLSDGTVLFGATALNTIGLVIDPSTGIISGVAAPNVDSGDYQIVVTATDLSGASVTADPITLNIGHVEDYGNFFNGNVTTFSGYDELTFGDFIGIFSGSVVVNAGKGVDTISFGNNAGVIGGSVVVNAGDDNDTIAFGANLEMSNASSLIDGGLGFDTLILDTSTDVVFGSNVMGIEKLQLTAAALNQFVMTGLNLDAAQVMALSDTTTLIIDQVGAAVNGQLNLNLLTEWTRVGLATPPNGTPGETYTLYTAGAASLYLDQTIGIIEDFGNQYSANIASTVTTDAGNDDLTFGNDAGFLNGSVTVNAGKGVDTISFGNNAGDTGSVIVNVGDGGDDISFGSDAGTGIGGSVVVNAGDDADTVSFGQFAADDDGSVVVNAGNGADTISFEAFAAVRGGSVVVNADGGADTISFGVQVGFQGGSVTVDAGADNDTITFGANLEMSNASSLIDGGLGFDTLILDTSTDVVFGSNVMGIEKLQLTAAALNQFVMTGLNLDAAQVMATSDTNTLIIDQVGAAVNGQLNLNLLTEWTRVGLATPPNGTPGETYTLYTAGAASLYLDQTIGIIEDFGNNYSLSMSSTVTTDAGNDDLTFGNGAGADSGSVTVNAGSGADMISFGNFAGSDGSVIVNAGDGVDTISFEKAAGFDSGSVVVNAGNGADMISFREDAGDSGSVVVNAGDGGDTISFGIRAGLNSGSVTVNAGDGADMISFENDAGKNGSVTVNAGSGADTISFESNAGLFSGSVVVNAGADNDTITFGANLDMLLSGELAGNPLNFSLIDGGSGFDTLILDTSTDVNFGSNVLGIEKLILSDGALADLSAAGLSAQNLLDMSDNDILIIDSADGSGNLNFANFTGLMLNVVVGIVNGSTIPNGVAGESYQLYDGTVNGDLAQLYINIEISVTGAGGAP